MSNIVPKLNLNKLPRNCEDYSLTCAKNVKIVDNTVVNFDKLTDDNIPKNIDLQITSYIGYIIPPPPRIITEQQGTVSLIGEYVGCVSDIDTFYILYKITGYKIYLNGIDETDRPIGGVRGLAIRDEVVFDFINDIKTNGLKQQNDIIILDLYKYQKDNNNINLGVNAFLTVYPYIENATIDGNVIKSPKGDTIIELHQYSNEFDVNVPVSFINLEEHRFSNVFDIYNIDNESRYIDLYHPSFYTQTPIVPIVNFLFNRYVDSAVQSGVYSLFIRFKTLHDNYSNWMSCSKPFFIGNHRKTDTQVGSFYYSDSILLASDYTIDFIIEPAYLPDYFTNKKIQVEIGYICKTEDEEYAAKLKEINIQFTKTGDESTYPTFTFVPSHANDERIDINDLLEPTYNLYNVKNVTVKDNTFFASNYKESNINEEIHGEQKAIVSSCYIKQLQPGKPLENDKVDVTSDVSKAFITAGSNALSGIYKSIVPILNSISVGHLTIAYSKKTYIPDTENNTFVYSNIVGFGSVASLYIRTFIIKDQSGNFHELYILCKDAQSAENCVPELSRDIGTYITPLNVIKYSNYSNSHYPINATIHKDNGFNFDNTTKNSAISSIVSEIRLACDISIASDITSLTTAVSDIISNLSDIYQNITLNRDVIEKINTTSIFVIKYTTNDNVNHVIIKGYDKQISTPITNVQIDKTTNITNFSLVSTDNDNIVTITNVKLNSINVYRVALTHLLCYDLTRLPSYHTYRFAYDVNNPGTVGERWWKVPVLIPRTASARIPAINDATQEVTEDTPLSIISRPLKLYTKLEIQQVNQFGFEYNEDGITNEELNINVDNATTLIPYQTYDFYVHLVKRTGEITNGKFVTSITINDNENIYNKIDDICAFYPQFKTDIVNTNGEYVLYFYSFRKQNVCIVNGVKPANDDIYDVPEMDLFLFNRYAQKGIGLEVKTENINNTDVVTTNVIPDLEGEYIPSSDIKHGILFGNSGKYVFKNTDIKGDRAYFKNKKYNSVDILYRCTPYIPIQNNYIYYVEDTVKYTVTESETLTPYIINHIEDLYFDGYFCKIFKPLNTKTNNVWIDSQYYKKHINSDNVLVQLDDVWDNDEGIILDYKDDNPDDTIDTEGVPKNDLVLFENPFNIETTQGSSTKTYKDPKDFEKDVEKIESINGTPTYPDLQYVNAKVLYFSSKMTFVYSNYNLNFLRLREDLIQSPRSLKIKLPKGYKKSSNDKFELIYETYYITLYVYKIAGTTLDSAYKTIPFYRDYTQLIYAPYDKNATNNKYDITIRKTERLKDIVKWSVPRFKSTLLYNLENHKGNITNLVAVGKSILIHTEKGLFAFETNSKLTSNNGEINIESTEIFDVNPVEITGSQNGYGGLQDKRQAAVCFEGYVFADVSSNEIFTYSENGFVNLTNHLKYLLEYCDIVDFRAANIQKHHICLCCVTLKNKITSAIYKVTLSYNFVTETFISLHDFAFTKSYANSINTILEHEKEIITEEGEEGQTIILTNLVRNYSTFDFTAPFTTVPSFAEIIEEEAILYPTLSRNNIFKSYIDVIVVNNYELVKVLEFLNWSLIVPENIISDNNIADQGNTAEIHYNCDLYNNGNEQPYNKENAESVMVCSDSASTAVIGLETSSNDKDLTLETSYTKPRYNAGIWSLNYFRNIKSKDSNEQTLIYGKYFVVRFVFNAKRFKFETLTLKLNKYV